MLRCHKLAHHDLGSEMVRSGAVRKLLEESKQ